LAAEGEAEGDQLSSNFVDRSEFIVLHIINSLGTGGAERQLIGVARATQQRGVGSIVVPLVARPNTISHSDLEVIAPEGSGIRGAASSIRYLLSKVGSEGRPVVLVAWMYHSWLAALIVKFLKPGSARVLFYCRHGDVTTLSKRTRFLAKALLWMAKKQRIPVVFNSAFSQKSHKSLITGYDDRLIPNSWDFQDRPNKPKSTRIGFLGRNHFDKGADQLPEIVSCILLELNGWSARLSGPGIDLLKPAVHGGMRRKGLLPDRVAVQGSIDDIDEFFSSIDVLLVPSRAESFPNVLVEAISRGVIPVCMDVGDAANILDGHMKVAPTFSSFIDLAITTCRLEDSVKADIIHRLSQSVRSRFAMHRIEELHMGIWFESGGCENGRVAA
jgi:glycosyltransferase involved in cell wall biosynthesis